MRNFKQFTESMDMIADTNSKFAQLEKMIVAHMNSSRNPMKDNEFLDQIAQTLGDAHSIRTPYGYGKDKHVFSGLLQLLKEFEAKLKSYYGNNYGTNDYRIGNIVKDSMDRVMAVASRAAQGVHQEPLDPHKNVVEPGDEYPRGTTAWKQQQPGYNWSKFGK